MSHRIAKVYYFKYHQINSLFIATLFFSHENCFNSFLCAVAIFIPKTDVEKFKTHKQRPSKESSQAIKITKAKIKKNPL